MDNHGQSWIVMGSHRQTCKTGEPRGTPVLELYAVKRLLLIFR